MNGIIGPGFSVRGNDHVMQFMLRLTLGRTQAKSQR